MKYIVALLLFEPLAAFLIAGAIELRSGASRTQKVLSLVPDTNPQWTVTRLTRQVEFVGEKCKCATAGNPAAHWAIRSAFRTAGAQRCAGCNGERRVQSASDWRRATRFRIANNNPTTPSPASVSGAVDGSGAVTVAIDQSPLTWFNAVPGGTGKLVKMPSTESVVATAKKSTSAIGPTGMTESAVPSHSYLTVHPVNACDMRRKPYPGDDAPEHPVGAPKFVGALADAVRSNSTLSQSTMKLVN
jgi:hypothetical protein